MNTLNSKNKFAFIIIGLVLFNIFSISKVSAEETTSTLPSDILPITSETTTIEQISAVINTLENVDLSLLPTSTPSSDLPNLLLNETATTSTPTVNLNIRFNSNLIFSKFVNLPTSTTITDNRGNIENTTSTTVLTTLISAQQETRDFYISDLQHSEYGYYLKCLYLSINSTSTCDNWNYVVDNRYPSVGMDSYKLSGGENIYIYFGDSWKITSERTAYTNTSTPFYTWKYDYSDTNKDWVIDPNDLVAITILNPNPTGWWDTDLTVSTTLSNENGVANFYFTSTGTYSAKITSEDYSKWSNPITFTVIELNTSTTLETSTTTTSTNSNGSSGSSNTQTNNQVSPSQINEVITKLLNFLKSHQDASGKISDTNTSDWATIAFGSRNTYASDIKSLDKSLYDFIYNIKITDLDQENNKCAGYSRHILALLAAGTSKTDPKIVELKNKLDSTCVQNNIFGLSGINDDVFGLIAALALNEDQNSPVITVTLNAIKTDQQTDGSFTWDGWSGADMTGAAINALKYAQNRGVTVDQNIFTKAKQYLKSQQLTDGGWGFGTSDALTTSWATMGINALGETQNDWFNGAGKNPWNVLTTLDGDHYTQSWDGGIDWFGTKHAVPALLGNSWPIILDPRTNINNQISSGASEEIKIPTSTITTTSTPITTSTLITTTTLAISTSTISTILSTTTLEIIPVSNVVPTITIKEESKPEPTLYRTNKIAEEKNNNEELKSASNTSDQNQIIDDLPLDTPTKRTAKKVLAISGGSALVVGAYLGLRLLRNVV